METNLSDVHNIPVIEQMERRHGAVLITTSDGNHYTLPASLCRRCRLKIGLPFNDKCRQALINTYSPVLAKEKVLRLLSIRARSTSEISNALLQDGYEENVISSLLSDLTSSSLIDDRLFTRQWISRRCRSGIGEARIRAELLQKGIPLSLFDTEWAASQAQEEASEALMLALRKAMRGQNPSDKTGRPKIIASLQRKGFRISEILSALRRLQNPDLS